MLTLRCTAKLPTGFVVDLDGNYWMGTQGGELVGSTRKPPLTAPARSRR